MDKKARQIGLAKGMRRLAFGGGGGRTGVKRNTPDRLMAITAVAENLDSGGDAGGSARSVKAVERSKVFARAGCVDR